MSGLFRPAVAENAAIERESPLPPRLHIDQSCMTQGMSMPMARRHRDYLANAEGYWQQAKNFTAQQPLLSALDDRQLAQLEQEVQDWRAANDQLVVIGTGGASLGTQALSAVSDQRGKVRFLDHCDAASTARLFASINPERTAWLMVSKSGETVETLATSLAMLAHYATLGLRDQLPKLVRVITCPGARPLRDLADQEGWTVWDHAADLGGRYSVFSNVGMAPALYLGMNVRNVLAAARAEWDVLWAQRDPLILEAAAIFAASLPEKPMHVTMAYGDNFAPYTKWYKQLWGESLGKDGLGPTPITAVGSFDQHSQLQLYLGGPADKCFTLLIPRIETKPLPLADAAIDGIDYLRGHALHDVLLASADGTYDTLVAHGLPVRKICTEFDSAGLCRLMARTMAESLLVAAMLGINPYNQPAVEEGKERTRRALRASHD